MSEQLGQHINDIVHLNDIVVSTYEIHKMHIACYGLVHINDIVVSTYEMYQMHIACYRC